jgi:hypothetical protein
MKRYYFLIEHVAEKENVRFSIDAKSLEEAFRLATKLNPSAIVDTEYVELEPYEEEITNF